MTASNADELLYAKLLGETAAIDWEALQPFFAKGALLRVVPELDLVHAAAGMAKDDKPQVAAWLEQRLLEPLPAEEAQDWCERNPELWAVVVRPWVLVQERGKHTTLQ